MIDGVNGLAGGVGLVTAGGIMVIAARSGASGALLIAAVLAGSMVSFLRTNLRPGGIFLGDSGSLYVGFMLSASTLLLAHGTGQALFPQVGLLLMGLPLVEVATTVVRRTLASRTWRRGLGGCVEFVRSELVSPDTGHLHHILLRGGMRAGTAALLLVGAATLYAVCSVAMVVSPEHAETFLAGGGMLTAACCLISLRGAPAIAGLTRLMVEPQLPSSAHDAGEVVRTTADAFRGDLAVPSLGAPTRVPGMAMIVDLEQVLESRAAVKGDDRPAGGEDTIAATETERAAA
jgi:UDP-GlcNAc:undecaprenyl-phosphate GlcNAc-1-phosphate transferase